MRKILGAFAFVVAAAVSIGVLGALGDQLYMGGPGGAAWRTMSGFASIDNAGAVTGNLASGDFWIGDGSNHAAANTATQATAALDAMVGDSGSGGTKGLVPAPASGDAAAGKFLGAGGTWLVPGVSPGAISLTNGHILVGNGSNVAADVAMGGDSSISNTGSVTNGKVNGVSYGSGPSTNTVPVVTGANAVTYEAVPNTALANSSITIAGHSVSLGGTQAIACADLSSACMTLSGASQAFTGGLHITAYSIGTVSSGTTTIDCGNGPLQYLTNGGAFTLAAPSNDSDCIVETVNNGSAGTITFSGFSVGSSTGDTLDTTNAHKFFINIARINGDATYRVSALQ
jgi:hypothetical protein